MKIAKQEKPLEQASEIAPEIFNDTPTIVHISPVGLSTQMHQEKGKIYLFSITSHYFQKSGNDSCSDNKSCRTNKATKTGRAYGKCTCSSITTTFDFADSRRSDSFKSK